MDNLTHGLIGVGLAGIAALTEPVAANPALQQAVFWSVMAASQAPDLDIISKAQGQLAYLKKHRGSSHSFVGLLALPTFITMVAFWFTNGLPYHIIWLWAFLGVLLHIFFDILTSYGTRFTWPINTKAHAWDILMIVELPLLVIGGVSLILWYLQILQLLELVLLGWLAAIAYILLKIYMRHAATNSIKDFLAKTHQVERSQVEELGVIPFLLPTRWSFVAKTSECYLIGNIYGSKVQVDALFPLLDYSNRLIYSAAKCSTASTFLDFARFPSAIARPNKDGYQVIFTDLRYHFAGITPLTAKVQLNESLQVIEESYGWGNRENLGQLPKSLNLDFNMKKS